MRSALLLIPLLLAACGAAPPAPAFDAPLGSEFQAQLGKPVRMDGISLVFTRVVEDSRCPKTVTCVWEGAATVALTVLVGEAPTEVTLPTAPAEAARTTIAGFEIELRGLDPYPDAAVRRTATDYVARLRVNRL